MDPRNFQIIQEEQEFLPEAHEKSLKDVISSKPYIKAKKKLLPKLVTKYQS